MNRLSAVSKRLQRLVMQTQFVPSIIVFVVLIIFSLIAWHNANVTLQRNKEQAVAEKVIAVETAIFERMQSSAILLRAGTGLFNASESVSLAEWTRFYEQFGIDSLYSGISGITYIPIIDVRDIDELERTVREDGFSNFEVKTNASKGKIAPVIYVVAYNDFSQDPSGVDLYQDANRRSAMMESRDSGRTMMTTTLQLKGSEEQGVILFRPVYVRGMPIETEAERRKAIRGYVSLGIETNELFESLSFGGEDEFGFVVKDRSIEDSNNSEIYKSTYASSIDTAQQPTSRSTSTQFGQHWDIDYYASNQIIPAADRSRPQNILITGVIIALVSSLVVFLLIQYRTKMYGVIEEQKLQKAKDELLSLASHQLRTPATGVKQYVGMVLDGFGGQVPDEQVKLLEQAYKSNERQLQIINEFLYVAKLGSGSLTVTRRSFDLAGLARDVCEEMTNEINERRHTLERKLPDTLLIKADEHSIRMIVENLLSNAVKYTRPKGKITISIERHMRDVSVTVKDNGVGIAKNDQKLLFKQFSRITNDLTAEVNGSGIGLYLAHQLAVRNGGDIKVDSVLGKGTSFTLVLPLSLVKNITNLTKRP